MGGACSAYRGEEKCIQGFDGETEGKGLFGRLRRGWKDNIKKWDGWTWTGLNCLRIVTGSGLAGTFIRGNGPSSSIKCGEFLD